MSELTQELDKLIQKAALDGALTKDAVEMFHDIVEENDKLSTNNDHYHRKNEQLTKENSELSSRASAAEKCAEEWAGREQDLLDREHKCLELEIRKECAEQRVTDHIGMVQLVLRNTAVRKTLVGQELVAIPGTPDNVDQYGNTQYGSGRPPDAMGVPISQTETSEDT